jgi:Fe-S-cluster containining protein
MNIETSLEFIATKAIENTVENDNFIAHLKQLNAQEIDTAVFELNNIIEPQIDCTICGNCCKTLMINVEEDEANNAAKHLSISREKFDEQFIEKSLSGKMLISKMPCHFLAENKCTIYESRFAGCKEFPALHLPQIQKRLFTVFMHYNRCPIIYNVVEQLKVRVGFN